MCLGRRSGLLVLALLGFGPLCAQVLTDSLRGLELSAFVDVYFAYDLGHSEDDERPVFLYQYDRHNEVDLNLGLLRLDLDRGRYRASFALMAGTYAQANLIGEPELLRNVFEATVGISLSKDSAVWLDAGVLPSHIGAESAIGIDNWTLTRSIAAENSPYYLSGARLMWKPSPRWDFAALFVNGWQRIRRVQNTIPCFGTQVVYRQADRWSLNWSTFFGSDVPDSLAAYRIFNNMHAKWERGVWGVQAGFDIGLQERSASNTEAWSVWYTPMLIVRRELTPRLFGVARGEYYADPDQVILRTGTVHGFTTFGYSLGCDLNLFDEVWCRLEGRTFHGVDAIYQSIHGPVQDNTSFTVSLAARF